MEPSVAGKVVDRPKMSLVECHSGTEYADRPLAFSWQGLRLVIAEILGRWRTPNEKGFRIKTTDGQVFELTYRETPDNWQVRPY